MIVTDHPSYYNCLQKTRQEHLRVRRTTTAQVVRITTLREDLSSGRKDVTAFLRAVAHTFANYGVLEKTAVEATVQGEGDQTDAQADGIIEHTESTTEREDTVIVMDHNTMGNLNHPDTDSDFAEPTPRRRRLRDLPSRRILSTVVSETVTTDSSSTPEDEQQSRDTPRYPVCLLRKPDAALVSCGHCLCNSCALQLMSIARNNRVDKRCPVAEPPFESL